MSGPNFAVVRSIVATCLALLGLPTMAYAEGSAELGTNQTLFNSTTLFVDILDSTTEMIEWSGAGTLTVYSPVDELMGTIPDGESLAPGAGNGVYRLELSENQTGSWDVNVTGAAGGRLSAVEWFIDGGSAAESAALDGSLYSLLAGGGGAGGNDVVIETKLDGYAGWTTWIRANAAGLGGVPLGNSLSSAPSAGVTADPQFPLFLNPPERASHGVVAPTLSGAGLGASYVVPGSIPVTVDFQSDVTGHALLLVDIDQVGAMDPNREIVVLQPVTSGSNQIVWDGSDPDGNPLAPGSYDLQLRLLVGLHSFLSVDVETSFEGFRQFLVEAGGGRTPLNMFWNDEAVYSNSVDMPYGGRALPFADPEGLYSMDYSYPTSPYENSRCWGNFSAASRGNEAVLVTFTFVAEDVADLGAVIVADGNVWFEDHDGDGYGDPLVWVTSPTQPAGYVADNTDCDDTNDTIYPGAPELCGDGLDNDCNGAADEGCQFWFEDYDGDGFGNPTVYVFSQTQPPGYVADSTDCDDTNDTVYPGAPEICDDGLDNDCNGQVDDGCQVLEILAVEDVGNDQGRQVRLTWARSPDDAVGTAYTVTSYSVYRRVDQYKAGEPWDFLASIPAHGQDEYNTIAPTLCDSTDAGICWSVFFVRTETTDPLVFFDTTPDSGWSVDNLAPFPPPNPLMAGNTLQWDPFLDPDARYATIYGSSTGVVDGSEVVLGHATGTEFDVTGMAHDYYLVSVTDFSGNEGEAVVITNTVSATGGDVPRQTALVGNSPNPFNPSTVVVFDLAVEMSVDLRIYDIAGRLVRTLESGGARNPGRHESHWDGRDKSGQTVSAGVYFCRMNAGDYTATVRMALVK